MRWHASHYVLLVLFGLVCAFLAAALLLPTEERSAQLARPAPEFALAALDGAGPPLTHAMLRQGEWSVVNIWASWCAPCRVEHPHLMALADAGLPIYGINYKDAPAAAQQFLRTLGNPYRAVGADHSGEATVAFGVYGIPETFVLDGEGVIRAHQPGALTQEFIALHLRPLVPAAP